MSTPRPSSPTLIPLPLLQGRWTFPRELPTFAELSRGPRSSRLEDDVPLVASADAGRATEFDPALVTASRWTTHDPRAALMSLDRDEKRTLIVNLLDPEPTPALQLLWGLSNLETIGVAVDALAAQFRFDHVLVAAYLNIPEAWRVRLKDFVAPRRAQWVPVPPRYPVADARVLARQFGRRHRSTVVLDAVVLREIGHALRSGQRPRFVPVAFHEPSAPVTRYAVVERGTTVDRASTCSMPRWTVTRASALARQPETSRSIDPPRSTPAS
ncbi:MAG: hypothetical protein QM770_13975 [Tepidisphaeraceae bacterium]